MRPFLKGLCFLVVVSCCSVLPGLSFSEDSPDLIHVENVVASHSAAGEEVPVCSNPDEHFFFDTVHPTTHTHYEIAQYACNLLSNHGIAYSTNAPQPSVTAPKPVVSWQ